ncbi:MAG: ribosome-associated translation inhibitor RaiA [Defluviitaleaceae bacterium]|nr:ribosome-associated translation inhibitor RaiA [Defluviitaleaceae bacterium]
MRFTFASKNINKTDKLKERAISKISKLDKLLPQEAEVAIKFSVMKLDHKVEVTVPLKQRTLRAEAVSPVDMMSAIDDVVGILEKQINKYKGRLHHKAKKSDAYKNEFQAMFAQEEPEGEHGIRIERTKKFAIKPMDAEEAVMEMELIGHNFYVFRDGSTDELNVVYKRADGSYGLIEPEF